MIERTEYLNELKSFKDLQIIKVITGLRRSGKSTLLKQYQNELIQSGVEETSIISVNLEELEYEHLKEYKALYKYIMDHIDPKKKNYIFIDEVQECSGFELAVDSLFVKDYIDLYITGSNAKMLSSDLATVLSGRYITIEVLPLSFKEYLSAAKTNYNINTEFRDYLRFGSLPYTLAFQKNEHQIQVYLEGIYNTILRKDIISRYKISNVSILEDLTKFIFDNIGNIVSSKKISDTLTSNQRKTNSSTIETYLGYLKDCFIIYEVNRYDIKGKQYLKSLSKYYVSDLGIRNYLLGYRDTNRGSMLENLVFLELYRKGYKVYIGKVGSLEVDFVATKNSETIYIQVTESLQNKETFEREMEPLRQIKDYNQRMIISTDFDVNKSYDGIKHVNILDFFNNEY